MKILKYFKKQNHIKIHPGIKDILKNEATKSRYDKKRKE